MIKNGYSTSEVNYIRRYKTFNIQGNDLFWQLKFIKKIWRNKTPNDYFRTMLHRNRHVHKSVKKWTEKSTKSIFLCPNYKEKKKEEKLISIKKMATPKHMKSHYTKTKRFSHSHRQYSFSNQSLEDN